jgi:hypothetical protein
MKVFLIAAVAIGISGAAFAKDLKGSVMSDSEMDKVTAGDGEFHCAQPTGCGVFTGNLASNGVLATKTPLNPGVIGGTLPPYPAGAGTFTAGLVKH